MLEQLLRPHGRADRVQRDADRLGELLEEEHVRFAEVASRGQLHDGLDVALEKHRKYDERDRTHRADPGPDREILRRNFGEQNAPLLDEALPDQPFTGAERPKGGRSLRKRVARDELQQRFVGPGSLT